MTNRRPALDAPKARGAIPRPLGQPHPQYVHRGAEILDLETGKIAHRGVAAVGADHEIGGHFERAPGHLRPDSDHNALVFDEIGDLCLHFAV